MPAVPMLRIPCFLALLGVLLAAPGCSAIVGRFTRGLAEDFTSAVLGQDDPGLVKDGAPAFLLTIDGLIEGSPDSRPLLLAGAQLYGAYTSGFVEDDARASILSSRALRYAKRAACEASDELCEALGAPFEAFQSAVAEQGEKELDVLYGLGAAWAGWVQVHSADWNAVADIPKLQVLMDRVVALDDGYEEGGAHLYLGVIHTLRPASLGGNPEQGRQHFERAVALSEGRNLMARVLFASQYARLVFDQELHDRLLREVLSADPQSEGYTLTNTLAQETARELLAESPEYF